MGFVLMITTITAIDPESRRRGFLVEVHPELEVEVPELVKTKFIQRLLLRNIHVGLLMTPDVTLVARDRLSAVDKYITNTLKTTELFCAAQLGIPHRNESLTQQALEYLTAVGVSWSSAVPANAMSVLIPEVVAELAQVDLETWDGMLENNETR
jgi:hypothetical protein